jgi:hypothetical protein
MTTSRAIAPSRDRYNSTLAGVGSLMEVPLGWVRYESGTTLATLVASADTPAARDWRMRHPFGILTD